MICISCTLYSWLVVICISTCNIAFIYTTFYVINDTCYLDIWSCKVWVYATRYFFASITCLINDLSCYAWCLTISYWYFYFYMTSCLISICYSMRLFCTTIYSVFDNIAYYCICWDRNFSCCISVITITAVFSFI